MSVPSTISVSLPKHLTPNLIARLARDVVMDLRELVDVCAAYGITLQQFERVRRLPFYKRVAEDFAAEWNKLSTTSERIRLISAVMLEEGLPRMGSQMVDTDVSPTIAVETGKFFAKLAGIGEQAKPGEGTPGEKFVINISLGEETKLKFDVTPQAPESVDAGIHESLSENASRTIDGEALADVVARPGSQVEAARTLATLSEGKTVDSDVAPGDTCRNNAAKPETPQPNISRSKGSV